MAKLQLHSCHGSKGSGNWFWRGGYSDTAKVHGLLKVISIQQIQSESVALNFMGEEDIRGEKYLEGHSKGIVFTPKLCNRI